MEGDKEKRVEDANIIQKVDDDDDNKDKDVSHTNTFSTKLSTDQLICKTPQESPSNSVKSVKTRKRNRERDNQRIVLFLGMLQFVLGLLMVAFGILVIMHRASLSQLGGGIWGGCLAMSTGVAGILTAAGSLCPLKETPQKVAYTVFLALSLISLAVSQLIVFIAATGLARDLNSAEVEVEKVDREDQINRLIAFDLPNNYMCFLFNIALIIASSLECVCAALASYKASRDLCPCFKKNQENYKENLNIHRSHALVSSWLGKHNAPPQIYLVAAPRLAWEEEARTDNYNK
ncbi:hypothetical protein NQ315_000394 [Exocentrus adspersus]|uniref:Uncharacterized protein n=1 Tax=Exocentrus adspersus TaxID=1586481 RepID=A0AAV8VME3_9CUCU|nr:hypothetical protein NQ315_000394 [Exocentrus adspersus]